MDSFVYFISVGFVGIVDVYVFEEGLRQIVQTSKCFQLF